MRTHYLPVLALLVCALLVGCEDTTPLDSDASSNEGACPSLVGSWELVSIDATSPAFDLDADYEEAPTLKILNDTHWMFIRQSSERFIFSQGGRYTLEDGAYTEIVGYSAFPNNIGNEYVFDCRIEGDSTWHHVGGLGGDTRYREIWRRVQ